MTRIPRHIVIRRAREAEFEADRRVLGGGPVCICGARFDEHEYTGEVFDSPLACARTGCKSFEPAPKVVSHV